MEEEMVGEMQLALAGLSTYSKVPPSGREETVIILSTSSHC
jgi:hypothetical protein